MIFVFVKFLSILLFGIVPDWQNWTFEIIEILVALSLWRGFFLKDDILESESLKNPSRDTFSTLSTRIDESMRGGEEKTTIWSRETAQADTCRIEEGDTVLTKTRKVARLSLCRSGTALTAR